MKAQLRTHVAALLLLAPVAATLVAQPAAAQERAAAPQIRGMQVNADNGLDPGSRLQLMVEGTPGSTAAVNFGKTDITIDLREAERGVYRGGYTVRRVDRIDPTSVLNVRLTRNGVTSRHAFTYPPSFQVLASGGPPAAAVATPRIEVYNRDRDRDNRTTRIVQLTPRQGDTVSPVGTTLVSGEFRDEQGRGVDPRTVRIMLDGRDVTAHSHITPERFSYRSDLPPGDYTAEVTARDHAGNVVSRSWSFEVGTSRVSAAPGSLPLHISSPSHGAMVDANGNLLVRGATVPWATVRVRVEAVPRVVGPLFGVAQTVYNDTIQADRDGRFTVEVNPRVAIMPGMRYEVSVIATHGDQTAESRITLHQRG